jgi:CBS domain-containing protein
MPAYCVRDLMTTQPLVCTPEDTVVEAARLMRDANVGALPVVQDREDQRVIGIVSDRDIVCRIVAPGGDPWLATVAEALSDDVTVLRETASMDDAVRRMSERQVRRLPVVDASGRLVGILAQADLARASADQGDLDDELAEVLEEISEPATNSRAD